MILKKLLYVRGDISWFNNYKIIHKKYFNDPYQNSRSISTKFEKSPFNWAKTQLLVGLWVHAYIYFHQQRCFFAPCLKQTWLQSNQYDFTKDKFSLILKTIDSYKLKSSLDLVTTYLYNLVYSSLSYLYRSETLILNNTWRCSLWQ